MHGTSRSAAPSLTSGSISVPPLRSYSEILHFDHSRPYVYAIDNGNKAILEYGALHTYDQTHPMLLDIKDRFEAFNPDLVLVEGRASLRKELPLEMREKDLQRIAQTSVATLKDSNEGDFLIRLAVPRGITVYSPEPTDKQEFDFVSAKRFSSEAIWGYYAFRMVDQWHRLRDKPGVEKYLERTIAEFRETSQWKNFDFSFENIDRIGKQFWGTELREALPGYYNARVAPFWSDAAMSSEVNEVSKESGRFRDLFIIQEIRSHLNQFSRIFVLFGSSHAMIQEPAIRELLGKKALRRC